MAEQTTETTPTPEQDIAAGLAKGKTATAAAAAAATVATAATAAVADGGGDGGGADGAGADKGKDEKPLTRAEMQKAIADAVAADRKGRVSENARNTWLTTEGREIPAELHSLIPYTSDVAELRAAGQKLENVFKGWIDAYVKKGRLAYVNIDGGAGTRGPGIHRLGDLHFTPDTPPAELIAAGLQQRRTR